MPLSQARHLWACANTLIEEHGDAAWLFASMRADALLAEGDLEGHRNFMIILDRVATLQGTHLPSIIH
nr:hypothetical protein [uncultured Sphingorhabdus sp.]